MVDRREIPAADVPVDGGPEAITPSDGARRGTDEVSPPHEPPDRPHYGLRIMRERAAAIGASVDWTSAPGTGTTVRLVIPLPGLVAGDAVLASGAR